MEAVLTVFNCLLTWCFEDIFYGNAQTVPTCNGITRKANCIILSVSILDLYCFNLSSCKSARAISFNDSSKRKTNNNGKALLFKFNPEKNRRSTAFSPHQNLWLITNSHCLPCAGVCEIPEHMNSKAEKFFSVFAVNSSNSAICSKDCTNSREQHGHGPK